MNSFSTEIALKPRSLVKVTVLSLLIWTIIFVSFVVWFSVSKQKQAQTLATIEARAHFEKDTAFRIWATDHGGVYVPIDEKTPPNPYLKHVPERDIETPSGKKLTLMNPAYMLRQIMTDYDHLYKVKGHITSLKPLNPDNAPDEWEKEALLSFEKGKKEAFEFTQINNEPHLRLMQPFVVQENCLKCHQHQGYNVGDIRGGVSVSVPLAPFHKMLNKRFFQVIGSLSFIWFLGLLIVIWFARKNYISLIKRKDMEKQLRSREKDLLRTQKIAHIGSWTLDLATNHVEWTEELYKMYGFDSSVPPPPYTEHMKLFTPESWKLLSESLEKTSTQGIPYELELETVKDDGGRGWMWVRGEAVKDSTGKIVSLWGAAQDITERKINQLALEKSESALLEAQRLASFGSWTWDIATDSHTWSKEIYRIYGRDPELAPAVYPEVKQYFTEESWNRLTASVEKCLSDGVPYATDAEVIRPDGSHRWVTARGNAIRNKDGAITSLYGTVQDITERKQNEMALKESEERFKTLHNASFGGICIHDNGIILECNKGLSDLTGYDYEELIGMSSFNLLSEKDRVMAENHLKNEYEQIYEAEGVRKNGDTYSLRLEGRKIPYKGKMVRVVELRDITTLKETEKEKEILQNQLIQAQKMESVGRLAGGVAHDFNNMLGIILGHADLILQDIPPEHPIYEDIIEIENAGKRSADLTRQLLAFARKQLIVPETINLNSAISSMLKMLIRLIGENIHLEWIPQEDLWNVKLDPSQIDQILANLSVNARDAIDGVGNITIETANCTFDKEYCAQNTGFIPGDYVSLIFSDTGCGIDKQTVSKIFEPFYTTKDLGKGTGLGLATVYGIMDQNKGFVHVYSEPDEGTSFKLYFPRHISDSEEYTKAKKHQPTQIGDETIMIVEDEHSLLNMTSVFLKKLGYTVLTASSPDEAIRIDESNEHSINLLLTDVIMPGMNGMVLGEKLKENHTRLKVLYMSGYTANVISHYGILDEGLHFIQKPFSLNTLSIKIREVLDM